MNVSNSIHLFQLILNEFNLLSAHENNHFLVKLFSGLTTTDYYYYYLNGNVRVSVCVFSFVCRIDTCVKLYTYAYHTPHSLYFFYTVHSVQLQCICVCNSHLCVVRYVMYAQSRKSRAIENTQNQKRDSKWRRNILFECISWIRIRMRSVLDCLKLIAIEVLLVNLFKFLIDLVLKTFFCWMMPQQFCWYSN